jgi:hypothetical protein
MYTSTRLGLGGASLASVRAHRDAGMDSVRTVADLEQAGFVLEATEWAERVALDRPERPATAEAAFVASVLARYTQHPKWVDMRYGGVKEMLALSRRCNGTLAFLTAVDSAHALTVTRAPPRHADDTLRGADGAAGVPSPAVEICMLHCNPRGLRVPPPGAEARTRSGQQVRLIHWEVFEYTLADGTVLPHWPFCGVETDAQRVRRHDMIKIASDAALARMRRRSCAYCVNRRH